MTTDLHTKRRLLHDWITHFPSMAVALSGGQDSAYLLAEIATTGLPVKAYTVVSPFLPKQDAYFAEQLCRKLGVEHILVSVNPLEDPRIGNNDRERCYYCKKLIFLALLKALAAHQPDGKLVEGSHADDLNDIRPGRKALNELHIASPLVEFDYTKTDITEGLRNLGLEPFIRAASACLATRIAFNEPLTTSSLQRIDKAEDFIRTLGLTQVRVRESKNEARIEALPAEFGLIAQFSKNIFDTLNQLGYSSVTLDLKGYRTGSWNEQNHR